MRAQTLPRYGSPDVFVLKDLPKPTPKNKEVLIRVKASSVNAADWRLMRADPFLVRLSQGLLKPKREIIGADMAGVIMELGPHASKFKVGDEVFADVMPDKTGSFADFIVVSEDSLVRKPENVSFEEAAGVPLAGITAYNAVHLKGDIQPGMEVLINGSSGGVGHYVVQLAKHYGGLVTAVCSHRNIDMVKSLGAERVVDYGKTNITREEKTYDRVIDNVGNLSAGELKKLLKPDGLALSVGFSGMSKMINIMLNSRSKPGKKRLTMLSVKYEQSDLQVLADLMKEGHLKTLIERRYSLEDLPEAIRYLETGHARAKLIINHHPEFQTEK